VRKEKTAVRVERQVMKEAIAEIEVTRPDSSLRYRRYINHLLTYLLMRGATSEREVMTEAEVIVTTVVVIAAVRRRLR